MITWKDTTSYSQRKRKDTEPRSWTAVINKADIMVHRHIHYGSDMWLLSSRYLDLDKIELKSKDINEAKNESLDKLKSILEHNINEMEAIIEQIK
ncbi:hypothetical protein PC41400_14825 [Paenibacillus chitinolyticus]|uniref:Uncharacterized protein n=1 Tax=Paenibacillus chitinolyticus TaxID=79263 RepID=A0A410WX17_9BACL|nr:hypothetical protein [Paenibacillus chitinolyticus]MCY9592384.1 hypothetical protein [Paenibacillus chitinolyticus]MCY9599845.1 hypothetical protein [Paenibacillus chitinolyticus]QAV18883.1 hypothetical protein PC41400_14825 [Paenibacillus chitinolyticus]